MNRKKRLMTIFLVPLIAVIVAQGLVPLLAIIFSGIRSKMSGNVRTDRSCLKMIW